MAKNWIIDNDTGLVRPSCRTSKDLRRNRTEITMSPAFVSGGTDGILPDLYFNNVSLLAHMDGANGSTTILDSSSYGHQLTSISGAALTTAVRQFGSASLSLDGGSKNVTMPDHAAFDVAAGDFTIEAWINPTSLPGAGVYYGIFCQRVGSTSNFAYAFFLNGDTSTKLFFEWTLNGTASAGSAASASSPAAGVWSHVAVVRQGTNVTVYLNGVAGTPANIGTSTIFNSTNTPAIGRLSTGASGFFAGNIDELRVTKGVARYTSNFTPATAAFPAGYGDPLYNVVSTLLHMDGVGGAVTDSGPLGLTFGLTAPAALSATQRFAGSAALSVGANGQAQCTNRTPFLFGNNTFTIEARVYLTSTPTAGVVVCAVWKVNDFSWMLGVDNTAKVFFGYSNNGTTGTFPTSTIVLATNTWHHIAVCRTSVNGDVLIFVNGVLGATASGTGTYFASTIADFTVGAHSGGTSPFPGYIDEVRVTGAGSTPRYTSAFTPVLGAFPSYQY